MDNIIFDYEKLTSQKENILADIKAEYKHINISTLGGKNNVALLISLSLDKKENWGYGIFENSRYYHFSIDKFGKVENFSRNYNLKKIRRKKAKSLQKAIEYINEKIKG